jgi:PAS domain S-box-containing protein
LTNLILNAVDALPAGGAVRGWNRAAERLLGWTASDVLGQPLHTVPPDQQAEFESLRNATLQGRAGEAREIRWQRRAGSPIEVCLWSAPLGDVQAQPTGLLLMMEDITERKQAEAALVGGHVRLQEALAELRATQQQVIQQERLRALGEMASGIVHDFNNALAPIILYSEMLLLHPSDLADADRVKQYLGLIHTAGKDAAAVVRRLREFYRGREADEPFERVPLDELVEQAISLTHFRWRNEAQARGATISVSTHVQAGVAVPGDAAALREALTNLILNAVDALPAGGEIEIHAQATRDIVVLAVRDDGTGMAPDVLQRCLEPFFTTKGQQGSGLGLGMVYGIVQRHGGTLEIDSASGAGTTVSIRLPVWRKRAQHAAPHEAPSPATSYRVLVIEDEPLVRQATADCLEEDGHAVEQASDGAAGLEAFRQGSYDLVLTDRAMPGLHGDQVAAAIKQLRPDVPVIMMTGFGDLMAQRGEHPSDVDLVLSKPLTVPMLRQAIVQVMSRTGAGPLRRGPRQRRKVPGQRSAPP